MTLDRINSLSETEAAMVFLDCCGSSQWAEEMARSRPYATPVALLSTAARIWRNLSRQDWLEAFAAHPKIGDLGSLRGKCGQSAAWSKGEQAALDHASAEVMKSLAEANGLYEKKFGHIFIVCAVGKTTGQMLELLQRRLNNDPEKEIQIAAEEQEKITHLRLEKTMHKSSITSHVLDLSRGRPAPGLSIFLDREAPDGIWTEIGQGTTNAVGRASNLLSVDQPLIPGVYRLRFATGAYFLSQGIMGFYPEIQVVIQIDEPDRHYHIPLMLSPFGYTTYRGN